MFVLSTQTTPKIPVRPVDPQNLFLLSEIISGFYCTRFRLSDSSVKQTCCSVRCESCMIKSVGISFRFVGVTSSHALIAADNSAIQRLNWSIEFRQDFPISVLNLPQSVHLHG